MPIAKIEDLLRRHMGLDSASVGTSTIERAVRDRMVSSGMRTATDYWELLRSSLSEMQELTETVVVPETWFFRDEEAFAALVALVNESIPISSAETLRILSVPCSTGEEPYSIAMALHDGGLSRNQINVDAVDISHRAIAHARRGIYGRNSFRSANLSFRDRHFRAVAEGYAIADWMSEVVKFHHGNLVSGQMLIPVTLYQVIYCRNLLIYFDRATQEHVMQTLHSLLAPTGILFVGPAEAYLAGSCGFSSVNGAASFAFRKTSTKRMNPKVAPSPVRSPAKPPLMRTVPQVAMLSQGGESVARKPADLATGQRLADQGRLQEAAECCERNIVQDGPSAEAYYLLGVVRDVAGEREQAADCYRRVVYLQPNHSEALTHLAILAESQGDFITARRYQERAHRSESGSESKKVSTE